MKKIHLKKKLVPICYKSCNLDLSFKSRKEENLPLQQDPEITLSNQRQVKKIKTIQKDKQNIMIFKNKRSTHFIQYKYSNNEFAE